MNNILVAIPAFIVTLGILITVHEFGHYWVARRMGVKVLRFSIGFGKPLWMRRAGPDNTEYVIAALPLGGYVKMLDEQEGEVPEHERHRAFNRQHVARRFAIVSAGPAFNFLFAILAYWAIFVVGIEGLKPVVGEVLEGSIAQAAGLLSGDQIVAVDGQATPTREVLGFVLLDKVLEREPISMTVRDQAGSLKHRKLTLEALPAKLASNDIFADLGIRPLYPPVSAVIGELISDAPAAQAGLQKSDRIVAADGQDIQDWADWVRYLQARPGQTVTLDIERAGRPLRLVLRLGSKQDATGLAVGYAGAGAELPEIPPELRAQLRYAPVAALGQALIKSGDVISLSLRMLGKMVLGEASLRNLSGPISIAEYAGYSASDGWVTFLSFLAIVSISLGVINLLPIPLLDGGHLMYYVAEAVKGSPVSQKVQWVGQQVGIALLLGMIVLAFYNDLTRLFGPNT
jgi:regulator of sigma E protease